MSNMFREAGGSLEDYGGDSLTESLMQPYGDVNPDALHNQFSVPKFGPGYMAGGGSGILGPSAGEPGWTGFGTGHYPNNYTGVGGLLPEHRVDERGDGLRLGARERVSLNPAVGEAASGLSSSASATTLQPAGSMGFESARRARRRRLTRGLLP